ncbi:MAG: sensor domain-containing diguanylate cyclase, partial [Acidimicrobiia bacterium]
LADHIAELKESREDLKRALTRFGQTLRSTHDLDQLLNDVVETSVEYLHASRGILFLLNPGRDRLSVRVARGFDIPDFELKLGEGLAGWVAESGSPIRLPNGAVVGPSPLEPEFRTALVVPVFSQERIAGVLCLYDKEEDQNFTESDMTSLLSLADSAGVAIENVLLHDEARRLSIVDTVVGTWNRRYFMLRFEQELERSARFRRPFSLLLIDIDDFKVVNDSHGHQRGDSVLVEVARRVNDAIREIDVFARFGGEEFVLILPETDAEGGVATAEKIRSLISDKPFEGNPPLTVTVSVGVSCYWEHGTDQESLIRAADMAMYEAKRIEGKNRVVLYTPPDEPHAQSASG